MYIRFFVAFIFSLTSGLVVAQVTPPADPLMPPGVQEGPPAPVTPPTPPPPPPGKKMKTPPTPPTGKKAKSPPTPPGEKPGKKKDKKKKH